MRSSRCLTPIRVKDYVIRFGLPGVIILAAGALRLWRLETHRLWLDEAFSVLVAVRTLPEAFQMLAHDSAQPLYHILLHYWIALGGIGETHLALLSALIGIALVALILRVGSCSFSYPVGIWAALITALSPIHLFYSRQIRMYGLLALLSLGAVALLDLACRRNNWAYWLGYAILTWMAISTHVYGFFLPAVAAVALWIYRPEISVIRRAMVSHALIGTGCLWWLPTLWMQIFGSHTPHLADSAITDLARSFYYFSFGQPLSVALTPHPIRWALSLICTGLVVTGLVRSRRSNPIWGVYLLVPLCGACAISFVKPAYFPGRYDMMVFPAWVMLVAIGLASLRRPVVRNGIGVALVGLTVCPLVLYMQGIDAQRSPRDDIAALISRYGQDGDVVVFTGLSRPAIQYAFLRRPKTFTLVSFPPEMEKHMAWIDAQQFGRRPAHLAHEADRLVARIEQTLPAGGCVWLVYSHPDVSEPLKKRLDTRMDMTVMSRQGERSYPVFMYQKPAQEMSL